MEEEYPPVAPISAHKRAWLGTVGNNTNISNLCEVIEADMLENNCQFKHPADLDLLLARAWSPPTPEVQMMLRRRHRECYTRPTGSSKTKSSLVSGHKTEALWWKTLKIWVGFATSSNTTSFNIKVLISFITFSSFFNLFKATWEWKNSLIGGPIWHIVSRDYIIILYNRQRATVAFMFPAHTVRTLL